MPTLMAPVPAPLPEPDAQIAQQVESYGPAKPYAFEYAADGLDGKSSRKESSDGQQVTGQYTLEGPGGINRVVNYIADENGFRASILTNEPGTESKSPAATNLKSSQLPAEEIAMKYGPKEPLKQKFVAHSYEALPLKTFSKVEHAAIVQPAVTTQYIQPAVTTQYIQPALTSHYIQPAITTQFVKPVYSAEFVKPVLTSSYKTETLHQSKSFPAAPVVTSFFEKPMLKYETKAPLFEAPKKMMMPLMMPQLMKSKTSPVQFQRMKFMQPIVAPMPMMYEEQQKQEFIEDPKMYLQKKEENSESFDDQQKQGF
ncbi:cuticle protein 10.9-like protein [Leptotrombidium deliense]|uniref:Cuticle protein 10.9-like protein n=1 Tax=Leptotrombidium deliense TaxID=299467 RepID=A0A443SIZ0_9ACAR|nr:cuticle protein 10.9-like protein [Leptotrombidium deliense]